MKLEDELFNKQPARSLVVFTDINSSLNVGLTWQQTEVQESWTLQL